MRGADAINPTKKRRNMLSFDAKKMFISHFVKAIYVYRDYNLDIEFNVKIVLQK